MSMKRWNYAPVDKERAAALAEETGIDAFLALLLTVRGISDADTAREFLYGGEEAVDPFSFMDMDLAVDRITRAIDENEPIAIFGDYDADGITATVLLYTYLRHRGANVRFLLPQRDGEGYGLHRDTVERLADDGVKLLVTVDNGIAAVEEVALAASFGIDVVVTDHHIPQEILPAAVAVVNPHRPDCESEFKDYAGVGVAFKLVCALEGDDEWALNEYSDLVAIGTLADIMPLNGENRVLVREGLRRINERTRPGLAALAEVAGAGDKVQTSSTAVFTLAPRINAAGRMGDPQKAAELLLSETAEEAATLAREIQEYNQKRQALEADLLKDVLARIDEHPEWMHDRVLVIDGEGWYSGIVGILAARILERYGKPCMLLSSLPDKVKGSGRSIKGFPLFDAIASCSDLLTSFGGHELAAGVSLTAENVAEFRRRINAWAAEHFPEMPTATLNVDCKLSPAQVRPAILDTIATLEPFGAGNALPQFALCKMQVADITPVGNGKHLRISVKRDGASLNVMWFHMTVDECPFTKGDTVDLACTLDRNEYRGNVSVTVIVKDAMFSESEREEWLSTLATFDALRRGDCQKLPPLPARESLEKLYRHLRKTDGFSGRWDGLARALGFSVSPCDLRLSAEILAEANLLSVSDRSEQVEISLLPAESKADLSETALWKTLAK